MVDIENLEFSEVLEDEISFELSDKDRSAVEALAKVKKVRLSDSIVGGQTLTNFTVSTAFTACNAAFTACNVAFTACNAAFTACNAAFTACNAPFTII
ncbi:hypothetical protein [Moorena bouillonii]|uniref:Uncharacterized protein n=1 Tax=Moorena bouillonii PNG TaxID=568701 RepID=A0A1U7N1G5_9CYAN|nr:hypothetical protein [Moorena bouillonii]OLT59815.1 hypothetical protein BJP37_13065 [Moorena bouillonii PNG]